MDDLVTEGVGPMALDEPRLRAPRVAVLWHGLSGYVHAELYALVEAGAEVLVFHRQGPSEAPFNADGVTRGLDARGWTGKPDEAQLNDALDAFDPDAILIISWNNPVYRRVARRFRNKTLRILCTSNQWRGTAKQWAGILASRWMIRPTYDAALVTGDRAADFSHRLGIPAERMIWGMNTCDHPRFAAVADARGDALPPRAFLYVGRLVGDKAIDVMAEGYRRYQARVTDPWPFKVAGTGPDARLLEGIPGVEMLGFVQPDDLPATFATAGCLLLTSRFEPWAVVIHEATAAGLPVVCTRECGASTRLVLDGYNGVVMSTDDADAVAAGLERISRSTDDERRAMGEASESLARQYSPERWAANLLRRIPDLRSAAGVAAVPARFG